MSGYEEPCKETVTANIGPEADGVKLYQRPVNLIVIRLSLDISAHAHETLVPRNHRTGLTAFIPDFPYDIAQPNHHPLSHP